MYVSIDENIYCYNSFQVTCGSVVLHRELVIGTRSIPFRSTRNFRGLFFDRRKTTSFLYVYVSSDFRAEPKFRTDLIYS